MNAFVKRHQDKIAATLTCFDRVVITGTLPDIAHAQALARHLRGRDIRLFDYPLWAEPFREELRANAERLAGEQGLEIEFIRRHDAFRKEARIKQILAERGNHPGLVHIFSAMESCPSFRPWHDKREHRTFLKPTQGKCLHFYFYFIDEQFGLCYVRVPTWAPFRLQVYFNGHNWLERQLQRIGIDYRMADNAFLSIDDPIAAQKMANRFQTKQLHRRLERWARQFCPVVSKFRAGYHWSLMQVELSTDIIFHRQSELAPVYERLVRNAVHVVKAEHVATFLGRKLTAAYNDELGNDFSTRIQGYTHPPPHGTREPQTLRQGRADAQSGMYGQRRHLLQTPPMGGTSRWRADLQARCHEENDLQPQRTTKANGCRQRAIHCVPGESRCP